MDSISYNYNSLIANRTGNINLNESTVSISNNKPPRQSITAGSEDKVTLSREGVEASTNNVDETGSAKEQTPFSISEQSEELQLSEEEIQQITKLAKRDTEVKTHEAAHLASAGQYAAGGASFTYEVGPNGKRYAVGGEVPIDISKESTPEETILKMQTVARAALAPANPSSADRRIAAQAAMLQAQARSELQEGSDNDKSISGSNETDHKTNTLSDETSEIEGPSQESSSSDYSISPNSKQMILNVYQSHIA